MLQSQNEIDTFETSDTFIATSLFYYGIKLLDVQIQSNGRGVFIFEAPGNGLVDYIRAGKMAGNFRNWFSAHKVLKGKLRDKKKEAGLWRTAD